MPCTEWLEGSQQRLHHFTKKWSNRHNIHVLYIERPKNSGSTEKRTLNLTNQTIYKIPTIKTHSLSAFYIFNSAFQFFALLKIVLKRRINVIIAEGLVASNIAVLVAKLTNRPIVYDYSDYYPDFIPLYAPKGILGAIYKKIGNLSNVLNIKSSNATVAASRLLASHGRLYGKNVFIVSNGVSSDLLGFPQSESLSTFDGDQVNIGFIGTLESWVSLETVIDAVYDLNFKKHLKTGLTIIGNGPKKPFLMGYANQKGVSNKVNFTGWIPYMELHKYIPAIDIFVLPFDNSCISQYSMPMKIHEYSLFRKPTISAPLSEIVRIYRDSVLYAKTVEEYVSCILLLLENEGEKKKLIQKAYRIARENSWGALAEEYEKILLALKKPL